MAPPFASFHSEPALASGGSAQVNSRLLHCYQLDGIPDPFRCHLGGTSLLDHLNNVPMFGLLLALYAQVIFFSLFLSVFSFSLFCFCVHCNKLIWELSFI